MKHPVTQFQKWFVGNMRRMGLTVSELAGKLHTTRTAIYHKYRNESKMPYVWIAAFCTIFGGDPEEIWGWIHE